MAKRIVKIEAVAALTGAIVQCFTRDDDGKEGVETHAIENLTSLQRLLINAAPHMIAPPPPPVEDAPQELKIPPTDGDKIVDAVVEDVPDAQKH